MFAFIRNCHNYVRFLYTTSLQHNHRKFGLKFQKFMQIESEIFVFVYADTNTAVARQFKQATKSRYSNSVNAALIKHTGCLPLLFNVIAIYRRLLLQSERARKSAVQLKILNVFGSVRFCSAIDFIIFADTLSRGIGVLER